MAAERERERGWGWEAERGREAGEESQLELAADFENSRARVLATCGKLWEAQQVVHYLARAERRAGLEGGKGEDCGRVSGEGRGAWRVLFAKGPARRQAAAAIKRRGVAV